MFPAIVGMVVGISVQPAISGALAVVIIFQLAVTFVAAVEAVIRVQQRVQGLTTFDRLTGAANRLGLELAVNNAMAFASRRAELTTLAMIDLDDFKSVNDAHGHLVGDLRLQETVDNWKQALRETDVVSRYGGDEFIVLFPRTDLDTARGLLDRLSDVSPVSWTAGLTHVEPGELLEDAIRRADEQMYATRSRERGASA
ncbi:MAG: GGDEF domain-containing protein [Nitriliruptoraceae bacterium]